MKTEIIRNYSSSSLSSLADSINQVNNTGSTNPLHINNNEDGKGGGIGGSSQSVVGSIASKFCSKKALEKRLPLLKWLPEYDTEKLVADIIAGITVGLTILPQGLAYATVAGLPPQYGLYSGFVGCFLYILVGGTGFVTVGPTAVMAIITYTYTHGKPPEYAVILCFLTGIVTLLMGIFKLGFIINFISNPVNSGFTSAAALTICSTQIKGLLGLKFSAEGFLPTISGTIEHFAELRFPDLFMSIGCCSILLILMKLQLLCKCIVKDNTILNKVLWFISTSRNALVVIITTVVVTCLGEGQPFSIVGKIKPGLPSFAIPPFVIVEKSTNITHSFSNILQEEGSAIIVLPLLALMEHITIAKAFIGEKSLDASQEMISIGLSNVVGSFFSSMPICGSFSRTTVNAMSGARTPLGGLITGTMVILALQFLTPYFFYIPKASLASVIVCAVIFMVDLNVIKPMWKSKKMEMVPWSVTFLVSLLVGLEFGMMIGVIISVVYLLYYAARPGIKVKRGYTAKPTEFILVELDRSLTFPSMEHIRRVISKAATTWGSNTLTVAIDCNHIQFADFTAATGLNEMVKLFKKRDQPVLFWKCKPSLIRLLEGVDNCFEFVTTESELEAFVDSRVPELLDVHTPHPQHRAKFSVNPM